MLVGGGPSLLGICDASDAARVADAAAPLMDEYAVAGHVILLEPDLSGCRVEEVG